MKYREILKSREYQKDKIEVLKQLREVNSKSYETNEIIKKEKFKYMFYNTLLKEGKK